MSTKKMNSNGRMRVAYVLKSFPEPSETFVADEIASLEHVGIEPVVLHVYAGDLSVVHPSARAVMAAGHVFKLGGVSLWTAAKSFARLLALAPWRSLRTLRMAAGHRDRWCYVQALPAAAWCADRQIDVLHAHFADINLLYAAAISAWLGAPYGVTTHRYDILGEPIELATACALLHAASSVVTISDFNRRHMVQKYGLEEENVKVIHCGVDLSRFNFVPDRIHVDGMPLRIMNVGRLVPIKAQDVLLDALHIVRQQGVLFRMDVIGGGELHHALLSQCQALGLSDVVTFHGAQPEAVVRSFLSQANLFVLSSRSEGLPVACIEALAVGTPVVATRIFGIPELITDGESGLLVPPDDPLALAQAIVSASKDADLRRRMGAAGRKVVEQGFDRSQCTDQLAAAWRSAASKGRGEHR